MIDVENRIAICFFNTFNKNTNRFLNNKSKVSNIF